MGLNKLGKGETLSELEICLKHSLAINGTQSHRWADFGRGSLYDIPSNIHLETFDKGGESYFFCPHFWQGSGTGSVHVNDLRDGWAPRDDLPFAQHRYWVENDLVAAVSDSSSSEIITVDEFKKLADELRGSGGILRS